MNTQRILIVEDEAIIAADLDRRVRSLGYETVGITDSGHGACDRAARQRPDLILMDIVLKGEMDGIQATRWIREELDIPVIYLTSHTDATTVNKACGTEPFGYILKPIDERELRVGIELALCRHRSERRLRQMERWMTTTLNSIGDGVIAVDSAERITLMNPFAEQLTGWPAAEGKGRPLQEVFRLRHAETGDEVVSPATKAMAGGMVVRFDRQTLLMPRRGAGVHVDDSAAPIRGDKGEVRGAVVVFRDATERIRNEEQLRNLNLSLERLVASRTRELSLAVRDLEHFTDSVSHDLRGPIMAVQGLASMLSERMEEHADEEAEELVRGIRDGVGRMERMLGAFERLAHVQRRDLETEPIDMQLLVEECINELTLDGRTPVPRVEVGPLPAAHGDAQLIRQVWVNLLSNAMKYSRKVREPRLEIRASADTDDLVFWVRDNGAGFDMRQVTRLFAPFQRLHSSQEFEGHGIGLATVKRVVERHGGRVWAEGEVGVGATFYFTLPKDPPVSGGEEADLGVSI